jgi:hypothetical protein
MERCRKKEGARYVKKKRMRYTYRGNVKRYKCRRKFFEQEMLTSKERNSA